MKQILNWIDAVRSHVSLTQIFLLLLIGTAVIATVKYFGKDASQDRVVVMQVVGKDWSETYNQHDGYRPPFWLTEQIATGDTVLASDGRVLAEVLSVKKYEQPFANYELFLTVSLSGYLEEKTGAYFFNGQIIKVGSPLTLNLNDAVVKGNIVDADAQTPEVVQRIVKVKALAKNLDNLVASNLSNGIEANDSNRTIARLVGYKLRPATSARARAVNNAVMWNLDTELKDVELDLELLVEKHETGWYYAGRQRVRPGETIWLSFPSMVVGEVLVQDVQMVDTY